MRIGIVGAGGAGLAAAWLLGGPHEVVVYERQDRLGGHAQTIDVDAHGQRLAIDAGFQFFGPGTSYATFNRLLDALGVARRSYRATMSLHRSRVGQTVALPPLRGRSPVWGSLTPSALRDLLLFRRFLADVPSFVRQHDTTITTGEYIERRRMPASFVDEFLFPLLQALWCVEPDDFRRFAAYNTLFYLSETLSDGFHPPTQLEIDGGMRVYIDAIVRDLVRTDLRLGVEARRVTRDGDTYSVDDSTGRSETFDHVVVATSAEFALRLIESVDVLEPLRRQLRRFEYFDTTIAIHGDVALMPPDRAAWSVVNARWDGVHSQLSIWNPERALPVFRSWVTYEERMPQPLYATTTYRHGRVTVDYFDAQAKLAAINGDEGLSLAGLYMGDADSHESAVGSAVSIAQRLVPGSPRLVRLTAESR